MTTTKSEMKKYKLPKIKIGSTGRIFITTYCVKDLEMPDHAFLTIRIDNQQPYLILTNEMADGARLASVYGRGKYSRLCSKSIRMQLEAIYGDLSDYSFVVDKDAKEVKNEQICYPMLRVA